MSTNTCFSEVLIEHPATDALCVCVCAYVCVSVCLSVYPEMEPRKIHACVDFVWRDHEKKGGEKKKRGEGKKGDQ